MLQELLAEVEKRCKERNHEVALFFVNRLCNYHKSLIALKREREYYFRNNIDDEFSDRRIRTLIKKVKFKNPCNLCPACLRKL